MKQIIRPKLMDFLVIVFDKFCTFDNRRDSLSIVVLFNSPLDQFYSKQPKRLFSRHVEPAVLSPNNMFVLRRATMYTEAALGGNIAM